MRMEKSWYLIEAARIPREDAIGEIRNAAGLAWRWLAWPRRGITGGPSVAGRNCQQEVANYYHLQVGWQSPTCTDA
jgi:hypothetical protein